MTQRLVGTQRKSLMESHGTRNRTTSVTKLSELARDVTHWLVGIL